MKPGTSLYRRFGSESTMVSTSATTSWIWKMRDGPSVVIQISGHGTTSAASSAQSTGTER